MLSAAWPGSPGKYTTGEDVLGLTSHLPTVYMYEESNYRISKVLSVLLLNDKSCPLNAAHLQINSQRKQGNLSQILIL